MPQGLQVKDDAGNIIIDTSTYTVKALIDLGEVTSSGSTTITIPPGTTAVVSVDSVSADYPPNVTVSGSTVSWGFLSGAASLRGRLLVDIV